MMDVEIRMKTLVSVHFHMAGPFSLCYICNSVVWNVRRFWLRLRVLRLSAVP
jgi:hypothetical protein